MIAVDLDSSRALCGWFASAILRCLVALVEPEELASSLANTPEAIIEEEHPISSCTRQNLTVRSSTRAKY